MLVLSPASSGGRDSFYPKYVVTMDPHAALARDSGIAVCSARQFILNS